MAAKKRFVGASEEAGVSAVSAGRDPQGGSNGDGGGGLPGQRAAERVRWGAGVRLYLSVAGAVGAATMLRWGLDPVLGSGVTFITYYPAVAVAAMVGGARAGLVAMVLSALAADFFFLEPRGSLAGNGASDWVALGLFAIAGGLISWMAERVDRARRREAEAMERKRGEEAVREEQARRERILSSITDAFFALDQQWRFTYVNAEAERLLSKPAKELLGGNVWELFHDAEAFRQRYEEAVASGRAIQFEEFYEPLGTWFEVHGYPSAEGLSVYFRDVTERKRAEEELRRVRRRLEEELRAAVRLRSLSTQLINAGGEQELYGQMLETAMAIMGADFASIQKVEKVADGSGRKLKLLAWRNFEPESARFWQLVADGSGTSCEAALRRGERFVITDVERSDFVAGTPDLEEFRRSGIRAAQSTPLISRSGRFLGMISTHWREPHEPNERDLNVLDVLARQIADLMERQQAEEALRRSEAWLARGVELSGLGLFDHDHERDVIEWSAELRRMLGLGPDGPVTIGQFLERVTEEDRQGLKDAIQRAHDPAGDGRFEAEYRVRHRDGQVRCMSVRSQTYFEGEGVGRHPVRTIGAVLDVTERKAIQAELERLVAERTARLEEAVGELEHFSYTITHDMRAPLRGMKGFAEMAKRLCGDSVRQEAKEALTRIETSAERMDALITDALSYSRSVRQELLLGDVDADALLRGMLESYPELQPSRANIQVGGRLPVVVGNEAGLTQCLSNLLGNAVKFVKPGRRPEIRIWSEERGEWARIWVEDKGIGISQDMLPRIFDMFSRGGNDYEGTGIGLALVRKVTQRMGGRVGVESEEGSGSRFWIELRLAEEQAQPGRVEAEPAEPRGGTVLYVEDEESDAMFMKVAFAEKGMESALRVVRDGREAIEYMLGSGEYADRREYPLPSVMLLDLNLPQVTGFEVLKWMRNHPDFARTPVVIFSSSTREDDRVKALELGASEFVGKPSSGLKFGEVVEGLRKRWMETAVGSSMLSGGS